MFYIFHAKYISSISQQNWNQLIWTFLAQAINFIKTAHNLLFLEKNKNKGTDRQGPHIIYTQQGTMLRWPDLAAGGSVGDSTGTIVFLTSFPHPVVHGGSRRASQRGSSPVMADNGATVSLRWPVRPSARPSEECYVFRRSRRSLWEHQQGGRAPGEP